MSNSVKINRPLVGSTNAITITTVAQTDTKPTKLRLKASGKTKSYSDPSISKNKDESLSIVLEKFYKDLNWAIPTNGFTIYSLSNGDTVAVENHG